MDSAAIIISSILYIIGVYGVLAGLVGLISSKTAAQIGADLPGPSSYLSMLVLGLFGFSAGAGLITVMAGLEFGVASLAWIGGLALLAAGVFWLTGVTPAVLYSWLSRVRIRIDPGRRRRVKFDSLAGFLIGKRRKESYDDKIENTIATAGILGVSVAVIDAVLAAKVFDLDFSSAGEVFAVICAILVFTTVFAAGALQRFNAFE